MRLTKRAKLIALISTISFCIVLTLVLWIFMPVCGVCGNRLCFGSCLKNPQGSTSIESPTYEQPDGVTSIQLAETAEADESYMENVYFIGDSRTVALSTVGIAEDHLFAEVGLSHENALDKRTVVMEDQTIVTIPDAVRITAPKIAIVNFGVNGIGYMDEESFLEEYREMILEFKECSPDTIFVIEAILPVSSGYEMQSNVRNQTITNMNQKLYDLAEELECYYLATDTVMLDDDGALKEEYNSGDGIHFSQAGYEAIVQYVKTHQVP